MVRAESTPKRPGQYRPDGSPPTGPAASRSSPARHRGAPAAGPSGGVHHPTAPGARRRRDDGPPRTDSPASWFRRLPSATSRRRFARDRSRVARASPQHADAPRTVPLPLQLFQIAREAVAYLLQLPVARCCLDLQTAAFRFGSSRATRSKTRRAPPTGRAGANRATSGVAQIAAANDLMDRYRLLIRFAYHVCVKARSRCPLSSQVQMSNYAVE